MKIIDGGKNSGKTIPKQPRKKYDWEAIEFDLLSTNLSIRAIGRKHEVGESTIRKHIKKNDIQRDLASKIKAEVKKKMVRRAVNKSAQVRKADEKKLRTKIKLTEKDIVEAAAEQNVTFIEEWDTIFQKTVGVAAALKKEIFKKIKVKIPSKDGKRARTVTVEKLDAKEKATVYNAVVKAETSVFEAMRKNLGIDETGGEEAPAILTDFGTGNYEKELERRKAGTDSV